MNDIDIGMILKFLSSDQVMKIFKGNLDDQQNYELLWRSLLQELMKHRI